MDRFGRSLRFCNLESNKEAISDVYFAIPCFLWDAGVFRFFSDFRVFYGHYIYYEHYSILKRIGNKIR